MQPPHPYSAQPYPQAVTLVHTSRNTPAIVVGCISVFLGVVALLFCWVPFLGMISLPFAGVGGLLAVIGFIVAACRSFIGWIMPVIGGVLCLIALVICIAITSAAGSAVSAEMEKQKALQKAHTEGFSTSRIGSRGVEPGDAPSSSAPGATPATEASPDPERHQF